jgi:hypothetical protein
VTLELLADPIPNPGCVAGAASRNRGDAVPIDEAGAQGDQVSSVDP